MTLRNAMWGILFTTLWIHPVNSSDLGDYTRDEPKALENISPAGGKNTDTYQTFLAGLSLWKSKEYQSAEESLTIASHDGNFELHDFALLLIAEGRRAEMDLKGAENLFARFTQKYPRSSFYYRGLLGLAEAKIALNKRFAAERLLVEIIRNDQTPFVGVSARWHLANIYVGQKRYLKAYQVLKELSSLYPDSTKTPIAFLKASRLEKRVAVKNYLRQEWKRRIAEENAVPGAVNYQRGRAYGTQGNYREGKDRLLHLVRNYPGSPYAAAALFYGGLYAELEGNKQEAGIYFHNVITSYPESRYVQEALFRLGLLSYVDGSYGQAAKTFERARTELTLKPESDRNVYWESKSWLKAGLTEHGASLLQFLTEKFPFTYYGNRATDELQKMGKVVRVAGNDSTDTEPITWSTRGTDVLPTALEATHPAIRHQKRLTMLTDLGLLESAAEEADYWVKVCEPAQKTSAKLALYDILGQLGHYRDGIRFAEKILEDMSTQETEPAWLSKLWKISYPKGYWKEILKASEEWRVDPFLVLAVIREESRFNHRATSRSRAMGLMQIIPSTGRKIAERLNLTGYHTRKLYDPQTNISMGTWYLSHLIESFGHEALALAAYNGGPGRVSKWKKRWGEEITQLDLDEFVEYIPIRETRNYVKKVLQSYIRYRKAYQEGGAS